MYIRTRGRKDPRPDVIVEHVADGTSHRRISSSNMAESKSTSESIDDRHGPILIWWQSHRAGHERKSATWVLYEYIMCATYKVTGRPYDGGSCRRTQRQETPRRRYTRVAHCRPHCRGGLEGESSSQVDVVDRPCRISRASWTSWADGAVSTDRMFGGFPNPLFRAASLTRTRTGGGVRASLDRPSRIEVRRQMPCYGRDAA